MHGPFASIESDLLFSGVWEMAGDTGKPNLAEYHLDWWNGFNQFNNDDILPAEGSGLEVHGGGTYNIVAAYLMRGDGAVRDIDAQSYDIAPEHHLLGYNYYYSREIIWYPVIDTPDLRDTIKSHIITRGAIAASIYYFDDYLDDFDYYTPATDNTPPNHTIAVVGWDDTRVTAAANPGAWLCKNSWGTCWGDEGYFWVAYDDENIFTYSEAGGIAFRNVEFLQNGYFYNYFYFHDYHGWCDTKSDCNKAFNAFEVPRDQALRSVSFVTTVANVDFTLKVFGSFSNGALTDELASVSGSRAYRGFHTVDLGAPVLLQAGDSIFIYVELSDGGQAFDRTHQISHTLGKSGGIIINSQAAPGESYYFDGIAWKDAHDFDSTANFCIKGLAVELAPKPVQISSIRDNGDGQSLLISWTANEAVTIDHYIVHYYDDEAKTHDSLIVTNDSSVLVTGLIEEQYYNFYVTAVDTHGRSSLAYEEVGGMPQTLPDSPEGIRALSRYRAVAIYWRALNTEIDFDYYAVIRDGLLLSDIVRDSSFIDDDISLGSVFHTYRVVAIDLDGNMSDTIKAVAVTARAAKLEDGRILAINRSADNDAALVDESLTGDFLREALDGFNYDYRSDTSVVATHRVELDDFLDYGMIIIGGESARQDDIASEPIWGGILDYVTYYLSIGGRVIIFGRWGEFSIVDRFDTLTNDPGTCTFGYSQYFHIDDLVRPLTYLGLTPISDFVGAHSQRPEYPSLHWDSVATMQHLPSNFIAVTGIPGASYPVFTQPDAVEIIYTYDSNCDSIDTEGKPLAWRYSGPDYSYVYFNLPFSFMERDDAVRALRQAITDLGINTGVAEDEIEAPLPNVFQLQQNYPNPFNPVTSIRFYNPESIPRQITVEVYNIIGQQVKLLYDGLAAPGMNVVEWDSHDENNEPVATGIYFYRLKAGSVSLTRKMVLLK